MLPRAGLCGVLIAQHPILLNNTPSYFTCMCWAASLKGGFEDRALVLLTLSQILVTVGV